MHTNPTLCLGHIQPKNTCSEVLGEGGGNQGILDWFVCLTDFCCITHEILTAHF